MTWTFAIRDDDTSFYTMPEELENCYQDVWDICPISLAVVPYHLPRKPNHPYSGNWADDGPGKPLGENSLLVSWLREKLIAGRLSVMLHGYGHGIPNEPEFVVGDYATLRNKIIKGRAYLEDLLDTRVRVFVPPQNRMAQAGMDAVASVGLNICPVQSMRLKRNRRLYNFLLQRWYASIYKCSPKAPLFFQSHYEIPAYSLGPRSNQGFLEAAMRKQAEMDGLFILSLHYWEVNEKLSDSGIPIKTVVLRIVEKAKAIDGCHFRNLNEIC